MAETNYPVEVPVNINYIKTGSSDSTGNSMLHPGHVLTGDFYVAQKPLPKFFLFEKNVKIYTYDDIPITINVSLPLYILIAIVFSIIPALFNAKEDIVSWTIMAVMVLIFQLISVLLSIFIHFWTVTLFIASQHAIHIWPFGTIGYGYDYKKKKFQFIAEILAPCSVYLLFFILLFVSTILLPSIDLHLLPILPMKHNLATNIVNELWKDQAVLLILHALCPIYPFGISRIIATALYPSKNAKQIAQSLLIPSILCAFIFIASGVYIFAPYLLFPGIWCLYQDLLWFGAIKKKSVHILPLYQMMDTRKLTDLKKEQEVMDMQEHEFQRYRKTIVAKQSIKADKHKLTQNRVKTISDSDKLDTHTVNPMFASPQQQGILDFESPPQNTVIPMIRKRKKRKQRDSNGDILYDSKGNIIYEYKYFMVPDPNYNTQQQHNVNQFQSERFRTSEPDNINHDDSNGNQFQAERFRTSEPNIRSITNDNNDNDDEKIEEDMPPAPPPNIREYHEKANQDDHLKQRKSQQFGFRKKDNTINTLNTLNRPKQFVGGQRGSLAIRVRSNSGKEEQLVNYIAPQDHDLTSQDNVNPLAFVLQKKEEKKRKKKQKQNTLSLSWNSKEKKMKKRLRKQRIAKHKQESINIQLSGIKEDSGESADDAFNIQSIPGPPPVIQPPTVTTSDSEEKPNDNHDTPHLELSFSRSSNDTERTEDREEKADILVRHSQTKEKPHNIGNNKQVVEESTSYDLQCDDQTESSDTYYHQQQQHPTNQHEYHMKQRENGTSSSSSNHNNNQYNQQRGYHMNNTAPKSQRGSYINNNMNNMNKSNNTTHMSNTAPTIQRGSHMDNTNNNIALTAQRGPHMNRYSHMNNTNNNTAPTTQRGSHMNNTNNNTAPTTQRGSHINNTNNTVSTTQRGSHMNSTNNNTATKSQRGSYMNNNNNNMNKFNNTTHMDNTNNSTATKSQRGSYMNNNNNNNASTTQRGSYMNNANNTTQNNTNNNTAPTTQRGSYMNNNNNNMNNSNNTTHMNNTNNNTAPTIQRGSPMNNTNNNTSPTTQRGSYNTNNNIASTAQRGPHMNTTASTAQRGHHMNTTASTAQRGSYMKNNNAPYMNNTSNMNYMNSSNNSGVSTQRGFYKNNNMQKREEKDDNDSVIGFQPPAPNFPQASRKKLPSKPLPSQNNGYGMMMAPPSRVQRQQFRASKSQKEKEKSIWDINENASDDGDDWKKNTVLGDYDRRKSKINDMASEDSMRRLNNAKKRKSIFDGSSDGSSSEDNERRLTVDLTNARNYSVSGAMGRL